MIYNIVIIYKDNLNERIRVTGILLLKSNHTIEIRLINYMKIYIRPSKLWKLDKKKDS